MTAPRRDAPLSPVRRRGGSQQGGQPPESFAEAEIARGQTDALLGALGRMQLRLDVIGREQTESLASIVRLIEQVLVRLEHLEQPDPPHI